MAQPEDGAAVAAAGYGHQRASHADRERVHGMLETAFAAGLLSKDDLDRGVNRTLASRTYAELAAAGSWPAEPAGHSPPGSKQDWRLPPLACRLSRPRPSRRAGPPGRPRGRKTPLRGPCAGS
jgi:hypothetical protein